MQEIKLIQVTPEQLTDLIREGVRKELQIFSKGLSPKDDKEELLTIVQVANMLQVSKGTIQNLTKRGGLTAYGIGRRIYYKRHEVQEALIRLGAK